MVEIKDEVVSLNTAQSMKAEFTTKKINGMLKAMIIIASSPIQINVSVARQPIFPFKNTMFVIYENVDFKGEQYIPIRVTAQRGDGEKKDFNQVEWVLNDRIRIFIKGAKNTDVTVVFRYI